MADYLFSVLLVFLAIAGLECAARYLYWYLQVRRDGTQQLRELLLGTFYHNIGFSGFVSLAIAGIGIFEAQPYNQRFFWLRVLFDLLVAAGITLNLISHWRVSQDFVGQQILYAIAGRIAASTIVAAAL